MIKQIRLPEASMQCYYFVHRNKITQGTPSLSQISFIFLMTPIDSSNEKNICVELFKATFTH